MTQPGTLNIGGMVQQSIEVITRPSVAAFERYERSGTAREAFIYVGLAAVIGALLKLLLSLHTSAAYAVGIAVLTLISTLLGFFVFTFAVNWAGKQFFHGSGSYDEVAYTFALFYAPLSLIAAVLGLIPIIGLLVGLAVLVGYVYYGYLAVQASMNIRDTGQAIILLVIGAVANWIVSAVITGVLAAVVLGSLAMSGAFGR